MYSTLFAERVLTTDELKTVVDQDFPLRDKPAQAGDGRWNTSPWTYQRLLLARRLMRDGRYDEAYDYFGDEPVTDEDGKQGPRMAKLARQYADDLEVAGRWWHQPTTRAAALFDAATLSRHYGMELFGYEGAPDFNTWGGAFEMESKLPAADGQGFVTPGELSRFDATMPQPAKRYHYRYRAADEARSATEFVPKRSQAFAAMLCQATSWVIDRDPPLASELYRRYLREGAYVPWGDTFGRVCPEPDFDGAERLRRHELWQRMKGFVRTFSL